MCGPWTDKEAAVACRMIGFTNGVAGYPSPTTQVYGRLHNFYTTLYIKKFVSLNSNYSKFQFNCKKNINENIRNESPMHIFHFCGMYTPLCDDTA